MQQKQKQKQKQALVLLIECLKSHLQSLSKLNEQILKKYPQINYPIRSLMNFYQKQLITKLTARSGKSSVFADILIWYADRLIGFVFLVQRNIRAVDEKVKKEVLANGAMATGKIAKATTLPNSPAKNLGNNLESNYGSLTDVVGSQSCQNPSNGSIQIPTTVEGMLRIPQAFLKKKIIQITQLAIKNCQQQNYLTQLTLFLNTYQRCLKLSQEFLVKDNQQKVLLQLLQTMVQNEFYKQFPFKKSKNVAKFSYRMLFLSRLKLRVKKANKKLNERKMRIQELIDGQKKYIDGLKDYIDYIKKPIIATKFISEQQQKILFSQIESILTLHIHFHSQLLKKFSNYSKQQTYGDILIKNFPYFKIYTNYILHADQAQALLLKLSQQHEEIQKICKKFMDQKQKKASDQLKQPTFRIARYQMLIKQILKNTNPIHPDHALLTKSQQVGIAMLTAINENVDKTSKRNRLNQLQQEFGTESRPIYIGKRELLEEFQLFYIHEGGIVPVVVFVCNDVVIVIGSGGYGGNGEKKVLKWIKIDQNFYVRKQEDNKTYKNVIKIHSEGFITFSAGNEEKHVNKGQAFFQLLQRVSKENQENNRMVYVQVIGTEQIGSTSFAKHTQYIVEIKYLGLRKFAHLRFSEMLPFVNKIQQHYQNDLNISRQQTLKKNWFNNHKSKTIQDRKRTIQQILQKMLNNQLVKKQPQFILQQLKLDKSFFKKTQQYKLKRLSLPQPQKQPQKPLSQQAYRSFSQASTEPLPSSISTSNLHLHLHQNPLNESVLKQKKKQSKQGQTILCATQIKLGRDLYHNTDDMDYNDKKFQAQKIQIQIHTMDKQQSILVSITEFFTVEDVCNKVSKLIGLRMNRDFRLFHEIGKKQLRVLDQEQNLMKIFCFPRNQVQIGFISSIKKILTPETHPKLVFKKYYFLPIDIQQSQCRRDLTRLRLLVYQIFSQIKDMKYQIGFDEYLLFLAMLIYIQHDGEPPQNLDPSYIDRIIPQTIFKLKNYTQKQWLQKCRPHLTRLHEQIMKIIAHNRQQIKAKRLKNESTPISISKTALHFGHKHLCSQIVINKIKSNPIFGSNLFYVQPYKDTYQKLGKKMAYNMWLAIKVEGLNLLTPSSKEIVLELKYKDIEKIFVYSQAIIFKMESIGTCEYRFNTYQSFEISQLVKYNKCLNQTLQELDGDEDLIAKARNYKQQSLIYRNINEEKGEKNGERDKQREKN